MEKKKEKTMDVLMAEGGNRVGTGGDERGSEVKWILTNLAVCADSMSAYCISAWKEPETQKR